MDFGNFDMGESPFSMGFGMDGGDAYSPTGSSAWDAGDTGENAATGTFGMDQNTLAKLWAKMGQGNQFLSQGSPNWDQVSSAGQQGMSAGQAYGNSRWLPDGDSNRENDFFMTHNNDNSYGLTPIMRHGWNAETASLIARVFAPMIFGPGGIYENAGTTAGTEGLGATFGSDLGNNFDAFGGGFGLEGSSGSGFDAALQGLGSSAPALNYGADEFSEEGLGKTQAPSTSSGGGIEGGISNGTQMQGGSGNASQEQTQLQRDFLKYAGNEVKPGAGNLLATGDKAMSDGKGLFGTDLTGQDLMTGLQSLYGMYQNNKTYGQQARTLGNMYGQNSPYAEELRKQLQRRDAAGGRRSQYGPREVELQAKLAQQYSQNAPALMNAMKAKNTNQMAMMQNLMGLGMKAAPMLQRLWGTQDAPTGDQLSMPQFGQMQQGAPGAFDQGFGMNQPLDGDFNMGFGLSQQPQQNYFNPQLGGGY